MASQRRAPAAGADREWISVVSYSLPAYKKRTICGLTLQTPAQTGPLLLIKFDILMTENADKFMFPLVTRSCCNFGVPKSSTQSCTFLHLQKTSIKKVDVICFRLNWSIIDVKARRPVNCCGNVGIWLFVDVSNTHWKSFLLVTHICRNFSV